MKCAIRKMLFISSLLFASSYAVEDQERLQVIMLEEEPSDDPTDVPEVESSEVEEEAPRDDEEDLDDE